MAWATFLPASWPMEMLTSWATRIFLKVMVNSDLYFVSSSWSPRRLRIAMLFQMPQGVSTEKTDRLL